MRAELNALAERPSPDALGERVRLTGTRLPAHMPVEASNVLRRAVVAGHLGRDVAALAHPDLVQLRVTAFAFEPLASRVWARHPTVTAYDAAYVALAEELDAPLATLDRRLARANGPTCEFLLPH